MTNTKRSRLIATLAIVGTLITGGAALTAAASTAPVSALPACAHEDSDNCYWDAKTQGNGQGRSFVSLNGVTYYAK